MRCVGTASCDTLDDDGRTVSALSSIAGQRLQFLQLVGPMLPLISLSRDLLPLVTRWALGASSGGLRGRVYAGFSLCACCCGRGRPRVGERSRLYAISMALASCEVSHDVLVGGLSPAPLPQVLCLAEDYIHVDQ